MKIKCIKGFRDKTTAEKFEDQVRIKVGDVLVCDDELALERIKKGFAVEVVEKTNETDEIEEVKEKISPKTDEKPRKRGKK